MNSTLSITNHSLFASLATIVHKSSQFCRVLDEEVYQSDSSTCKEQMVLLPLSIHCNTIKYHVLNIIDWICITTLTHTVFEPALPYCCIPIAARPQPLPTNAIQFEVVPNADVIRQQPADRQLECSLPNLPQISGANIAAYHYKHFLMRQVATLSAASPQQHRHSLPVECWDRKACREWLGKTPPGRPKTCACELSWSEWAAQEQRFARMPASPAAHHPSLPIGSKNYRCLAAFTTIVHPPPTPPYWESLSAHPTGVARNPDAVDYQQALLYWYPVHPKTQLHHLPLSSLKTRQSCWYAIRSRLQAQPRPALGRARCQ